MRLIVWLLCSCCTFTQSTVFANQFSSDVPLLQKTFLKSQFWLATLPDADRVLLTSEQVAARNKQTFALQPQMQLLADLPAHYSQEDLRKIIRTVSAEPSSTRFYEDGTALSAKHWHAYLRLLALDEIKAQNVIQFGLIVKRTALRAFPTEDRVFNAEGNKDLDRFAETALFPADAVAVLHHSSDKQWRLVRSYNYTGWVKTADIAIGNKQQVLEFTEQQPFLVVTGAKVHTAFTPEQPEVSELQFDMGIRLPLLNASDTGVMVNGQNSAASYIVKLPQRNAAGQLVFMPALIPLSADVVQGYLPFTEQNIIKQAFKFLGERYGWGHDYNGRDCTGFISEIFRSMGLLMPRNSSEQGMGTYGQNIRFSAQSEHAEKREALKYVQPGDLFYFPGHVSLYLGRLDDQPFMIHDVNTLIYPKQNGDVYRGKLNGVFVTPLLPLNANAEQSYLDALYAIKSLR